MIQEPTILYRSTFAGSAQPEMLAEGVWSFRAIKRGFKRKCNKVHVLKEKLGERERGIAATARDSGLKFVAFLTHSEESAGPLNPARDRIVEMVYAASFIGRPGTQISEAERKAIFELTSVSEVFLDNGTLILYAFPKIVGGFEFDFFSTQLDYFLTDLRRTGIYLYT